MDRRTSLKSLVVLMSIGVSSLSFYKWLSINSSPDLRFLLQKRLLIAELAEAIIPRTDTPGAKDARVENFIITIIVSCSDVKTQNNFIKGLRNVENFAQKRFNMDFIKCKRDQKIEILNHFEQESRYAYNILNKINNKFLGKTFFSRLKELTVEGYCTSMIGATQGLAYDYIPGTFNGCAPLTKKQRSWATK